MNSAPGVPSSHGVSHAETSAGTKYVNDSTAPATLEPNRAGDIQVPRSPQAFSLQIDRNNAASRYTYSPNTSFVESTERGSDTSGDSQRLELHSASTLTDSLPSLPSSLNDDNQAVDFGKSENFESNAPTPRPQHEAPDYHEASRAVFVNGNGAIDGLQAAGVSETGHSGSLEPPRSSKQQSSSSEVNKTFAPGHKRTATGDIKPAPSSLVVPLISDTQTAARRRSKSIGSAAHGSRIAQLSVHIRTRLSYAAAKVEKTRQSRQNSTQLPLRGLETFKSSGSLPLSQNTAPPTSKSTIHSRNQSKLHSDTARAHPSHHRSQSMISSPGKMFPIPKLAPPVDIISSNGETRRRRPDPNSTTRPFEHSPYARHRRHHSHQEDSQARQPNGQPQVVGPGTPSILPTRGPTSAHSGYPRPRTNSQNTLMEQDAIETLLFMSSPENSGYRSSPRPLQQTTTQRSLNESIYSNQNRLSAYPSQSSQSDLSYSCHGPPLKDYGLGLEARAGDEIDRLLDQMESDSEDDARSAMHRQMVKGQISRNYGR